MADEKRDTGKSASDAVTLQLAEEIARIETTRTVSGRVRVTTSVEEVEDVARAVLNHETVEVTRVAIGQPVETAPPIRTEGDTTIVPVLEEILVVEKRLVLKEEVHIRRVSRTEAVERPVTLRREAARIERIDVREKAAEAVPTEAGRPG